MQASIPALIHGRDMDHQRAVVGSDPVSGRAVWLAMGGSAMIPRMKSVEQQRRDRAKRAATQEMERVAAAGTTTTYSRLADLIADQAGLRYRPDDGRFATMLCEISRSTDVQRRVLLSAVVIHATDDLPGEGFFNFARERGRSFDDESAFHALALEAVHASYA